MILVAPDDVLFHVLQSIVISQPLLSLYHGLLSCQKLLTDRESSLSFFDLLFK